ncbi:DUF2705 family protein [Priestia megaterium]|uniref:DUF2705 family protein n=1 Tax=Priestia megaterium TaxID=1404 RepID=UPI001BEB0C0F|nr:DUF2705 family protein [Priestia megaterium]MBT2259804.1 DUF2705 family protein [Priestia megaterium]
MKNKGLFLIILISFTLQSIINGPILAEFYPFFSKEYTFLLGLPQATQYQMLMLWYLTFASISFYFSGRIKDILYGYGKYIMIRNYDRVKWVIVRYIKAAIMLATIVLLKIVISHLVVGIFQAHWELEINMLLFKSLVIYYLTFLFLLLLQLLLELYLNSQIAFLFVNTYVVGAILTAGLLFKYKLDSLYLYFLIPNYAIASRLNITSNSSVIISYFPALIVIVSLITLVLIVSVNKVKKMDLL